MFYLVHNDFLVCLLDCFESDLFIDIQVDEVTNMQTNKITFVLVFRHSVWLHFTFCCTFAFD